MKVYFLSGIGADHRLFVHLTLPPGFVAEYLNWIPHKDKETLQSYAARMAEGIDAKEPFVIIGMSLGGIIAVEIAKLTSPACTIIISSVPTDTQLPPFYRIATKMHLHRLIPATIYKLGTAVKNFLTMKGKENRMLMRSIIWSGDDRFIRWGLDAVLKWKNNTVPQRFYHIHGSRDLVFPFTYTSPHYVLKGGHMLVMKNPQHLNRIIHKILSEQGLP
jgi:pimeloyl-ACP methyl ester carboxylesterase